MKNAEKSYQARIY